MWFERFNKAQCVKHIHCSGFQPWQHIKSRGDLPFLPFPSLSSEQVGP